MNRICEVEGCGNLGRKRGYGSRGKLCETHHRKKYPRNRPHAARATLAARFAKYADLSEAGYEYLLESQGGVCSICGQVMEPINIDHDHDTGRVRGLLCTPCNLGLGAFKDNLEYLSAAVLYLIHYRDEEDPD